MTKPGGRSVRRFTDGQRRMVARDVGKAVGKALIPPGIDPTLGWRLTVSFTMVTVLIWIAWAMGLLAGIGLPGFARAEQQNEILEELKSQKIERLEGQILQFQRDLCAQPLGSRPRTFYLQERNRKLNEYQQLTGNMYEGLPSCDEV